MSVNKNASYSNYLDLSNITYLYKTGNQTAIAYYEEIYDVINS